MNFLYDHGGTIGLIFFFLVFVGIALRTYRPGAKKELQEQAKIPLREEENE